MRTRTTRCLTGRLTGLTAALILTSTLSAVAQTPYVPYFGKNQIRYDNFRWHIYTTDHFEIYYYPEIEQHLERVAGYAESAYQQVSADLKHDLAFKIPLILFKTSSEFQQQNVIPGAAQEGVGAFAEPFRDRMVLPIDEPPDLLYRLVVHELTHIFEFDIIPQSLDPAQRAAVGQRGAVGLHDRHLAPHGPDERARLRGGRHRAEDVGARGLRRVQQPASDLQPGPRGLRVHRVEVGQGRHPPVPLRAAQERDRRRRRRVRRGLPAQARGVRPAVREVPEGSLQGVPRQGAAGRLRAQPVAESPEDEVHLGALHRAGALGRPDGGDGRQPARAGAGHRAAVDQGRHGGAQPDQGLRPGDGLCLHRDSRRPVEHGVLDVVVAGGRSAGVLRPHGKREGADPAGRGLDRHQAALPDEDRRRARVAVHRAGRPLRRVLGAAQRHRRHLPARHDVGRDHQSHRRRVCRLRADVFARRQVDRLPGPHQRQREAVQLRPGRRRRRRSSPSARTTRARPSSSTAPRWCSRRRP